MPECDEAYALGAFHPVVLDLGPTLTLGHVRCGAHGLLLYSQAMPCHAMVGVAMAIRSDFKALA